MSRLKVRSLISFSDDITEARGEILKNFKILDTPKGKKAFSDKIDELTNAKGEVSFTPAVGLMNLLIIASSATGNEDDLPEDDFFKTYVKFKKVLKDRPFDIHYNLVYFTEYMYHMEHQSLQNIKIYENLRFEVYRNEFITIGRNDYKELFKVEKPIDQSNINFPLYFAYTIRQMSILKMNNFLNHQRKIFEGDFDGFIESILIKYEDLFLGKTKAAVTKWLEHNQYLGSSKNKKRSLMTESMKIRIIEEELAWLSQLEDDGMTTNLYNRVIKYAKILVLDDKLDDKLKPLPKINYSGFNKKITCSFFTIHKAVRTGRRVNDKYIDFLHAVFPLNFTGGKATTKKKFYCQKS